MTTHNERKRVHEAMAKMPGLTGTLKEIAEDSGLPRDRVQAVFGSDMDIKKIAPTQPGEVTRFRLSAEAADRVVPSLSPPPVASGGERPVARKMPERVIGKDGAAIAEVCEGEAPPASRGGRISTDDPLVAAMRSLTGSNFLKIAKERMPMSAVKSRMKLAIEDSGLDLIAYAVRTGHTIVRLRGVQDRPQARPGGDA